MKMWREVTEKMFYHRDTEDTEFWKSENLNPKLRVLCVSVVNNFSVLSSPLCALLPGHPTFAFI
jgi:hypothetical protein